MYQLVAINLGLTRKRRGSNAPAPNCKLTEDDSVLLKDQIVDVCNPMYTGDYRTVSFLGNTEVEVLDSTGKVKVVHISDVRYVLHANRFIAKLQDYQAFGR